jgi:hypothetical protein
LWVAIRAELKELPENIAQEIQYSTYRDAGSTPTEPKNSPAFDLAQFWQASLSLGSISKKRTSADGRENNNGVDHGRTRKYSVGKAGLRKL